MFFRELEEGKELKEVKAYLVERGVLVESGKRREERDYSAADKVQKI